MPDYVINVYYFDSVRLFYDYCLPSWHWGWSWDQWVTIGNNILVWNHAMFKTSKIKVNEPTSQLDEVFFDIYQLQIKGQCV